MNRLQNTVFPDFEIHAAEDRYFRLHDYAASSSYAEKILIRLRFGTLSSAKLAMRFFRNALLSYNYGTAHAVTLASSHGRTGPGFWLDSLDMAAIRQKMSSCAAGEKMEAIEIPKVVVVKPEHESVGRRIVRFVTANGFVLPSFMIRDAIVLDDKNFRGDFRKIFRSTRSLRLTVARYRIRRLLRSRPFLPRNEAVHKRVVEAGSQVPRVEARISRKPARNDGCSVLAQDLPPLTATEVVRMRNR